MSEDISSKTILLNLPLRSKYTSSLFCHFVNGLFFYALLSGGLLWKCFKLFLHLRLFDPSVNRALGNAGIRCQLRNGCAVMEQVYNFFFDFDRIWVHAINPPCGDYNIFVEFEDELWYD